jgi:hypothetical protein
MTQSFEHEFKGFGRVPSKCLVMIFSDDGENLICFNDLNQGTSVTNASEQLASEIVNKFNYYPSDCRFFETYRQYNCDTFDEIMYNWRQSHGKWEASDPVWRPSDEMKEIFI